MILDTIAYLLKKYHITRAPQLKAVIFIPSFLCFSIYSFIMDDLATGFSCLIGFIIFSYMAYKHLKKYGILDEMKKKNNK